MWMLWIFGNNIEDRLGHVMFVCFYLLGGLVATFSQWFYSPHETLPLIGASGAVAAVLGGYAITYPWARVRTLVLLGIPLLFDLPALVVLGFWFILQMASAVMLFLGGPPQPVAFWAHIGGFAAGIVLMPFLALGASPPGTDWRKEADDMFRFDDPRMQGQ
jgi:membrane associated rhomboid family serine protease